MSEKVCNLLDELQAILQSKAYRHFDRKIVETLDAIAAETGVNKNSGDPKPKIWFKYSEAPTPTKIENERSLRSEAEMLKEFLSPEDYQDAITMSRGGTD